jgi:putative ABC transport system ATP-binding protein
MVTTEHTHRSMVRLEQIGIVRTGQEGRVTEIVRDVSFTAHSGEITAIVGPSGGGKSSLIRLINRLSDPTVGTVYLDGEDIAGLSPLLLRRRVAMVMQKPFMFEGTVLANLQRPFFYSQEPLPGADSAELQHALDLARLDPGLIDRDSRTLSLGEQQRVSLARALITHPHVLLLDEPTSALDRPTADHLAATFLDICRHQKLTVILVTHDLRLAGKIADHLIYLEGGQIRESGRAADLLSDPRTAELRRFLAGPEEKES